MPKTTKTLKRDVYTKKLVLSISPQLHKKIHLLAVQKNRTVQGQIRSILESIIGAYEKHHGPLEGEDPPEEGDFVLENNFKEAA